MMLEITGYVMKVAPLAVFAAIAATVTTNGLGILLPSPSSWAGSISRLCCCGR